MKVEEFRELPKSEKRRLIAETLNHYVYRCYDSDGVLLYIGCTTNVQKRLKSHFSAPANNTASWWLSLFYADHEVEGPFPGRAAGRATEAAAIAAEHPLFNLQGNGIRHQRLQRVAIYLVENGERSLAIDTCCICRTEWIVANRFCRAHYYRPEQPRRRRTA